MSIGKAKRLWSRVLASGLLVMLGATHANAQDFFPAPRDFVVDKACKATRAIRSSDGVALDVGKSYQARGVNKASDPSHAQIRIDGGDKWVKLDCGHFADAGAGGAPNAGGGNSGAGSGGAPNAGGGGRPAAGGGGNASGGDGQCLPFFDNVNNPESLPGGQADITPPAPTLDAFDKAVVNACGAPGKSVTPNEFKTLMRANAPVLERIKAYTGGRVYASRPVPASTEAFLSDLTDAWFEVKAFDHIFCGEVENSIGGLHFHGRYLDLQEKSMACRLPNFNRNEVVSGVIYTMGVRMKGERNRWVSHQTKGYGLTMSAEDLLKFGTRAFKENPTGSGGSKACILSITDDGKSFKAVFVRRRLGIRTFYPDATPGGEEACAAALN